MRKITHSNEIFSFLHIRTTMAENFTQISNRLTFPRIAREGGTKRWKGITVFPSLSFRQLPHK